MPHIKVNGNVYTCESAHIEVREQVMTVRGSLRLSQEITLEGVTHINEELIPVEGGRVRLDLFGPLILHDSSAFYEGLGVDV